MSSTHERPDAYVNSVDRDENQPDEAALILERQEEIKELVASDQTEAAVAKFDGGPELEAALSEEQIAEAKRHIDTARFLGLDAMGAFAPLHISGGSVVTVDEQGIHLMPEREDNAS